MRTNLSFHRRRGRPSAWALAVVAGGGLVVAASCKDQAAAPGAAPSATVPAPAASPAAASSATSPGHDEQDPSGDVIRPVYPIDHKPPLPAAEQYCNAVRDLPRKRKDECCPAFGSYAPTGECIRTLSSALRSGAVVLDAADLETCVAAVTLETAGCDWVTSVSSPTTAACLGIIKGTLKEGALCRSNLECTEGMRCRGLSATTPGKCGAPLPSRTMCNISTDSLAVFAGQDDVERHHPECAGYCAGRVCADAVAAGAACTATLECSPKARCIAGKCAEAPAPRPGEACTDVCAAGARCWKGKCVAAKAGGESCEADAECRSRCDRGDGGKVGRCTGDCPSFSFPKPPAKGR